MKPGPFSYHAPGTLQEAVNLLATHENAKVLAGGQSLLPMMNFRLAMPDHLIDINDVPGLSGIEIDDQEIRIGAMTRHRDMEFSTDLHTACPLLGEALPHIGHRQTRNRGTIGGSLAHADPAAELPTVALALDGIIETQSPRGLRQIPMAEFAVGFMTTSLEPDEIVTRIVLPRWPERHGSAFLEFARRRGDFALVSVVALVALDAQGRIAKIAVAIGGTSSTQLRLGAVEQALLGKILDQDSIAAASAEARSIEVTEDIHASKAYRQHLAEILTGRALYLAGERARP
jgi:carbon-monoxide dehydrogenase medium subunit